MNRDDSNEYVFWYARLQRQSTPRLDKITIAAGVVMVTFMAFLAMNIITMVLITRDHLVISLLSATVNLVAILIAYFVRGAAREIWDSRQDEEGPSKS